MDTNDNVIDEPKLSLKKRIIIFSVIFFQKYFMIKEVLDCRDSHVKQQLPSLFVQQLQMSAV